MEKDMRKLVVHGIPTKISDKDLFLILNARVNGILSIKLLRNIDKYDHNYGFVEINFESNQKASDGIQKLNEFVIMNKSIRASFCCPRLDTNEFLIKKSNSFYVSINKTPS